MELSLTREGDTVQPPDARERRSPIGAHDEDAPPFVSAYDGEWESRPDSGAGAGAGTDGMDFLEDDTGWVYVPGTISNDELDVLAGARAFPAPPDVENAWERWYAGEGVPDEPEMSPEEIRARAILSAASQLEGSAVDADAAEAYDAGGEGGLWRNSPLSLPRTSALPRGGRTLYTSSAPSTSTSRLNPLAETFSPANPPRALNPFRRSGPFSSSVFDLSSSPEPAATDNAALSGSAVRSASRRRRSTAPSAPDADLPSESSESDGPPPLATHASPRYRVEINFDSGAATTEAAHARSAERLPPRRETPSTASGIPLNPSPPRRRTREETNAMMGHALRAKKPVWVLYCGGGAGAHDAEDEEDGGDLSVPAGFEFVDYERASEVRRAGGRNGLGDGKGCGALVCARALVDGVPPRLFGDVGADGHGVERPAAASDLPPAASRIGDIELEDGTLGEKVGKRGAKGCKGCVTRDLACKRCGNHLGYRLLRPCVTCSISRPAYTSYANVVSSAPASAASNQLTLSSGGVTGGGVVDGLLFHFRLDAVRRVRRLVGRLPEEEWDDEAGARLADGVRGPVKDEVNEQGRLVERKKEPGEGMTWKEVPSPQCDFLSNLISEPQDWLTPAEETWWLENAVARHTQLGATGTAGGSGRRRTASEAFGGGSAEQSPSHTSLTRSGAIRHRIPLAYNPEPPSVSDSAVPTSTFFESDPSAEDNTRRLVNRNGRLSLSSYGLAAPPPLSEARATTIAIHSSDHQRRVRQRLGDPAGEESGGVMRALEGAGYGSGFGAGDGEGDGDRGASRGTLRRRKTERERRERARRESVGR
ncbi:hypothetical protein JCM10207_005519 [Rhodosporidiobolus poonsookiae]